MSMPNNKWFITDKLEVEFIGYSINQDNSQKDPCDLTHKKYFKFVNMGGGQKGFSTYKTPGVYLFVNLNSDNQWEVLYVDRTKNLFERISHHEFLNPYIKDPRKLYFYNKLLHVHLLPMPEADEDIMCLYKDFMTQKYKPSLQ